MQGNSVIPDIGAHTVALEQRMLDAARAGPIESELAEEIAEIYAADDLDTISILAYARALSSAGEVLCMRGDEDGHILHGMARDLIGRAIDELALSVPPVPDWAKQ